MEDRRPAMITRLRQAVLCGLLLGTAAIAQAEPQCVERYPTPAALASMFDVALATTDALDALEGVDVVLVARGGQDLSKYGLRHSHVAFLLREDDGQWRAVHLLNPCKTAQSHLFREGVDGEAVSWAAQRLVQRHDGRRSGSRPQQSHQRR